MAKLELGLVYTFSYICQHELMSGLGVFIVVLITAAATYYGTTSFSGGGGNVVGGVSMSPDVQKYIDSKLSGAANADQEIQKLTARLAEMEAKLVEAERVRASFDQVANKSAAVEEAIAEQRRRKEDAMQTARAAEMAKLRNEIATVCAGVTIKRVQAQPVAPNLGGSAGRQQQNPPGPPANNRPSRPSQLKGRTSGGNDR